MHNAQKVIVFFPHNPYPPKSGAHKRCLEMLAGLKAIGCEVTLLSSTLSSDNKWEASSVQSLESGWVKKVVIYKPTFLDYKFIGLLSKFYRLLKRTLPLNSALQTPPGMRQWFLKILHETSPNIILMNYASLDGLLNHQNLKSVRRIIETHDLITLNNKMRQALDKYLPSPPISADEVEERVLKEDFFEELNLTADAQEFSIYDKYDYTIAISAKEADAISQNTQNTKVVLIPVTQEPYYISNHYTDSALFPTGPNLFNVQGYLYFVKRVLPQVLSQAPSFCLQVTGSCCKIVSPAEGISLSGFVPDLKVVYESAKFVVCPVFGGTGQQVKIVEAMAHGVPVIALYTTAAMSPIRHGVNGLVARNACEFADYVVQLWNDKELCRKLGNAARDTIATDFSRTRLLEGLALMLESK